ncbi:hypothetical protein BRD18_06935 [Halobacteriales archaeon SW_7_71_33]|nr:MAG: hypothetical protein BRD18_06935 [Halobacteriales archaeon SW_7_71_33]
MRAELRAVPGLLALVPALLATRGNVYGSLGARLSTALHQGLLEPRLDLGDRRLRAAIAGALASGALASVFAALLTVATLSALGQPVAGPLRLAAIALLSALTSGAVLSALVVAVVVVGYRRGVDPDTLVGPTVTVAGDVFGLALLLVAVRVVLTLLEFPALLVLVPVTIGTAGNLGSVLAARLSTALHLGTVDFEPGDETLAGNALATVALAATLFPAVGVAAWLVAAVTGGARLPPTTVVLVATLTGLVLSVLAVAVTLVVAYGAYRYGADPDDVAIPVVTNVADVLGVLVLLGVVRLLV